MRKRSIQIMMSLAALIAVLIAIFLFALHTRDGRRFLADLIEEQIETTLGGEVMIGRLSGPLPGHITLQEVSFNDALGTWAHIDRLSVEWRAFSMLFGKIDIDRIDLDGARLLRLPPQETSQNVPRTQPFQGFSLPQRIPRLTLGNITISDVFIARTVAGDDYTFNGGGAARLGRGEIGIRFQLDETRGIDRARGVVTLDKSSRRLLVDIDISSDEGGALAYLLGDAASLRATGDTPIDDFNLTTDIRAGAFADIVAELSGNLSLDKNASAALALSGNLNFKTALNSVAASIGTDATFDTNIGFERADGVDQIILKINRLASDMGALTGTITSHSDKDGLISIKADAKASRNGASAQTANSSRPIELNTTLERRNSGPLPFYLTTSITGYGVKISTDKSYTDLSSRISGELAVDVSQLKQFIKTANPDANLLVTSGFSYSNGADVALRDVVFSIDGHKAAFGDVRLDLTQAILAANLSLDMPAPLITNLAPDMSTASSLTGTIALNGPVDNLALTLTGRSPELIFGESQIPVTDMSADINGLPARPTGTLKLAAIDDGPTLNVVFNAPDEKIISIPTILLAGAGYTLSGDALLNRENGSSTLHLSYNGAPGAVVIPGVSMDGAAVLHAEYTPHIEIFTAALESSSLRVNTSQIKGLRATAKGPLNAIETRFELDALSMQGRPILQGLNTYATIDLEDRTIVSLNQIQTTILGTDIIATKPARIELSDAITLSDLSLRVDNKGTLDADAAFGATRWQGKINAVDVRAPGTDFLLSSQLAFDTDALTHARGTISLQSIFISDEDAPLFTADLIWTADHIRLATAPQTDTKEFALDLSLPFKLVRSDHLNIDYSAPLRGNISYKGRAERLVTLGPEIIQGLEGDLSATARLSGTFNAPLLRADLSLEHGGYTEYQSGISLANINLDAQAGSAGQRTMFSLNASASGSETKDTRTITLTGEGSIGEASNLTASLVMNDTSFSADMVPSLLASGEVIIKAAATKDGEITGSVNGDINLDLLEAEIAPPSVTGFTPINLVTPDQATDIYDSDTNPASDTPMALDLDINITAPQKLFVRGLGLDSEWRSTLNIGGTTLAPRVIGSANLRRGTIDFSGRRFNFDKGDITFDRLAENNPRLDLRAEYASANDTVAQIVIGGRALSPSIELRSTPPLPQEDVMALVLFGKPASDLSAFETLQIAQALARLSGVGPFGSGPGITDIVRSSLGLDILNFDIDAANGTRSLTAGKYIADGFFVSATQSTGGNDGAVRVEYEITNSVTVETELRQDGDQTVSANWKIDF